jgi:hypothetical protein
MRSETFPQVRNEQQHGRIRRPTGIWTRLQHFAFLSMFVVAVTSFLFLAIEARAQVPNISCPGQWSDDGKGYRCVCADGAVAKFTNGSMVCSQTRPDPNSLTWHFQNRTSNTIGLGFYSQDRDNAWPGYNQAYNLIGAAPQSYALSCISGEHICFGAWYLNDPQGTYWGAGFNREQSCTNCCYTCGSSPPLIPIDP